MTVTINGSGSITEEITIDGVKVGQGGGNISTNTAVGASALAVNTTGNNNTAIGSQAGSAQVTGASLTAVGYQAARLTTVGQVSAFGDRALRDNTTGSNLASFGYASLLLNTTGSYNSAFGDQALFSNTTGANNTAVGYQAGVPITTGTNNVLIGYSAGSSSGVDLVTGSSNIVIGGNRPTTSAAGSTHQIVLATAANIAGKGNNTGFISPNGGGVFQGDNSSSWSTTSDQRLKKNIVDNTEGLDKINAIQVRNFEYRLPEEVDPELKPADAVIKSGVQLGVIAQELQQVCPDCVKQESTGVLSVDSDNIFWHMVNAIKELSAQVTALQTEVNALKGQ